MSEDVANDEPKIFNLKGAPVQPEQLATNEEEVTPEIVLKGALEADLGAVLIIGWGKDKTKRLFIAASDEMADSGQIMLVTSLAQDVAKSYHRL